MRAFIKAVSINVKFFFYYRTGFLLSIFIHPFILVIYIKLFESIYSHSQTDMIKGYGLDQMIWYFACVNFIWIFIWNFTDTRVSEKVLSGDLTVDLVRPMTIFNLELAHATGLRIVGVLLEFSIDMIIFSIIYPPKFLTAVAFIQFFILAIGAFFLMFLLNFLVGLNAFYLKRIRSLSSIKFIIFGALGGAFIPLEFFPDDFNRFIDLLPFKYIFFEPIQFFLSKETTDSSSFFNALFFQLLWIIVLFTIYKLTWRRIVQRYCATGG